MHNAGDESEGEDGSLQDQRSAMAKAVDIATRLITVSLCLVLPIIGGYYLDQRLGTVALFLVFGLLFGIAASGLQLIKMLAPGGILSDETPRQPGDSESERD